MTLTKLLLAILCPLSLCAQWRDDFSDGNHSASPAWTGNTTSWIVNGSGQLQSNNTTEGSTFYLSTASALATSAQWELYLRLAFNTSSQNYVDLFLTASESNLASNTAKGYFVRVGHTADEVALYRKDGATATRLIDGTDGLTNSSNTVLRIKVVRDATHRFTLYVDKGATGAYTAEGAATDATYTTSSFFGILIKQSTASFFQKHYFDDITIGPYTPDVTPPAVRSVTAINANTLEVLFDEAVEAVSSQQTGNYSANNGIGQPLSALQDAANQALVRLTFPAGFPGGATHQLTITGVKDGAGNTLTSASAPFSFQALQAYDVVIDEIMADPSPAVGLPNAEWVEIRNRSGRALNLSGWRLATGSDTSGAFPAYSLPADSFLVLCSNTQAAALAAYGRVLGVPSFPALPNEGTTLHLVNKEGAVVHAVAYSKEWYGNAVKEEGGWSLEMIDATNPCTGSSNWKAGTDSRGGTPGSKNSIDGVTTDETPPQLKRAYALDPTTLVLVFDESLDSTAASLASRYTGSQGLAVAAARALPPMFNTVQLTLAAPLQASAMHTLTAGGLTDCKGNAVGVRNTARIGLPQEAAPGDVVINEVLFNPRTGGSDYVEVFNRSNKVLDAAHLLLAARNAAGGLASLRKLSEGSLYLFPGDYLLLTEDPEALGVHYFVQDPDAVLALPSFPSYPDEAGTVVLVDYQGAVLDEVAYTADWHFALMSNAEGVSLERLDPAGPSQEKTNWHSAASTAGYGTPGYKNSQYLQGEDIGAVLEVAPPVFSPDNDGHDDVARIHYSVGESGYVANVTVFDARGQAVRQLVRNGLMGVKGQWVWDGLGEKSQRLPVGTYVIYTELFNLQGKKKAWKRTVVLGRRL